MHSTAASLSVANDDSPFSGDNTLRIKATALSSFLRQTKCPYALLIPYRNIMQVFAVSGYSGTGKTALVEHIISALIQEGYKVATVKSTRDDIYEEEGTDSWRHRRAGANITIILGPSRSYITLEGKQTLQSLVSNIDADYLIIEGMKESPIPKIWCMAEITADLEILPQSVKAIVSLSDANAPENGEPPILRPSEIRKIIEIVKRESIDLSELHV
jgi:molybdopterin-guanine dinucleotide biosynthesis protein B